jgi:hypothetical protein
MLTHNCYRPTTLANIAPRIGSALDSLERHEMRGIKRCTCGEGWRITGLEYFHGCIDYLSSARAIRDAYERNRMWEVNPKKWICPKWVVTT